ncbi:MAG: RNA methyltransferase [Clostridia bacterium]|nr:RNA methyltransferase [Clostridia bacterium]
MQPLAQNHLKRLRRLTQKKYRGESRLFVVEGTRAVLDALESKALSEVLVTADYCRQHGALTSDTPVYQVEEKLLCELYDTRTPQGIAGIASFVHSENLPEKAGFYLFLDGLSDPGNLGTILRTADASACDGVILTADTVELYNAKTVRATMGSLFHPPIYRVLDKTAALKSLKSLGCPIVVSALDGAVDFKEAGLKESCVVVVGNEAHGVSDTVMALADRKVKIPMPGSAESLNAGVAAALLLYEHIR